LQERPEGGGTNHRCVITQEVNNVWYQAVKLCFVRKMHRQGEKYVQCSQLARWLRAIPNVGADKSKDDKSRSIYEPLNPDQAKDNKSYLLLLHWILSF